MRVCTHACARTPTCTHTHGTAVDSSVAWFMTVTFKWHPGASDLACARACACFCMFVCAFVCGMHLCVCGADFHGPESDVFAANRSLKGRQHTQPHLTFAPTLTRTCTYSGLTAFTCPTGDASRADESNFVHPVMQLFCPTVRPCACTWPWVPHEHSCTCVRARMHACTCMCMHTCMCTWHVHVCTSLSLHL